MESVGSLLCRILSLANRDNLTLSFPICVPFISFCCLTALANTLTIIFNRSEENIQPCLVLYFHRILSIFLPFNIMLAYKVLQATSVRFVLIIWWLMDHKEKGDPTGSYLSILNYCLLMGSKEGVVNVFTCVPTDNKPTKLQRIVKN